MDCNLKKISIRVKIGDKYNLSLFNNEEGIVIGFQTKCLDLFTYWLQCEAS